MVASSDDIDATPSLIENLYIAAIRIMCVLEVEVCDDCAFRFGSRLTLCSEGKAGRLCVGPETPSGMPFLNVSINVATGVKQMDAFFVVPSNTITMICSSCRRTRPRSGTHSRA